MRTKRSLLCAVLCVAALVGMLVAGCSKPPADTGSAAPVAGPKAPSAKAPAAKSESAPAKTESTTESKPAEELKVGTTVENLQAAFNGESNASAKYTAFAKKADEEGYKQVAVLFRAAAKAEEIHASNHKAVIEKLGGSATATLEPVEAKNTKENLEAAIAGETYELTTMYPAFLKVAQADKNPEAIRSLTGAMKVEGDHAKLYKEAVGNLEAQKTVTSAMYVCPKCGYTTKKTDFTKCPVCGEDPKEFLEIK